MSVIKPGISKEHSVNPTELTVKGITVREPAQQSRMLEMALDTDTHDVCAHVYTE